MTGLEALRKICSSACEDRDLNYHQRHEDCKKTKENEKYRPFCNGCLYCEGSKEYQAVEGELRAFSVLKRVVNTNAVYRNMLDACLECGWITADEYRIAREALER